MNPTMLNRMTHTELITALSVMLNRTDLGPELQLSAISTWDSVAVVEFQALADEQLGIEIPPTQLAECRSVADLIALVQPGLTE